jgi:hypothetical protein
MATMFKKELSDAAATRVSAEKHAAKWKSSEHHWQYSEEVRLGKVDEPADRGGRSACRGWLAESTLAVRRSLMRVCGL